MPTGEHESVSKGVLGFSNIIRKPTEFRPTEMYGNIKWCVSEGSSEVA
jgi:hypothetical protein|tara:strand:+ start:480 stop:623 length:144 start_codon:yes stop_codon:yes gene_type:complete